MIVKDFIETGFNNTSHPEDFMKLIWELQMDVEYSYLGRE